jgi:hypothetical protein
MAYAAIAVGFNAALIASPLIGAGPGTRGSCGDWVLVGATVDRAIADLSAIAWPTPLLSRVDDLIVELRKVSKLVEETTADGSNCNDHTLAVLLNFALDKGGVGPVDDAVRLDLGLAKRSTGSYL